MDEHDKSLSLRRKLDGATEDDVHAVVGDMVPALGISLASMKSDDLLEFFHRMVDARLGEVET